MEVKMSLEMFKGVEMVRVELSDGRAYHYDNDEDVWYNLANKPLKTQPIKLNWCQIRDVKVYKSQVKLVVENKPILSAWYIGYGEKEDNIIVTFLDRIDSVFNEETELKERLIVYARTCGSKCRQYNISKNKYLEMFETLNKEFKGCCAYIKEKNGVFFEEYVELLEVKKWIAKYQFKLSDLHTIKFYTRVRNLIVTNQNINNPYLAVHYYSQLYPLTQTLYVTEDIGGYTQEDFAFGRMYGEELGSWLSINTIERMIDDCFKKANEINYTLTKNNFLKEYQKVRLMYQQTKKLSNDRSEKLKEKQNQKYAFENDDIIVIVPTTIKEFAKEAVEQKNCVYAYHIQSILNGKENIVFIREKTNVEKSWITCSIRPHNNTIIDILGYCNNNLNERQKELVKPYRDYLKSL